MRRSTNDMRHAIPIARSWPPYEAIRLCCSSDARDDGRWLGAVTGAGPQDQAEKSMSRPFAPLRTPRLGARALEESRSEPREIAALLIATL
jgi:hypothetical protein